MFYDHTPEYHSSFGLKAKSQKKSDETENKPKKQQSSSWNREWNGWFSFRYVIQTINTSTNDAGNQVQVLLRLLPYSYPID